MPASRAAVAFVAYALLAILPSVSAAEDVCGTESAVAKGSVTNDCIACITDANGNKRPVGAWCAVSGGGSNTEANCIADPSQPPGVCRVTYCTLSGECMSVQQTKRPPDGLKIPETSKDLEALKGNSKQSVSPITPSTPSALQPFDHSLFGESTQEQTPPAQSYGGGFNEIMQKYLDQGDSSQRAPAGWSVQPMSEWPSSGRAEPIFVSPESAFQLRPDQVDRSFIEQSREAQSYGQSGSTFGQNTIDQMQPEKNSWWQWFQDIPKYLAGEFSGSSEASPSMMKLSAYGPCSPSYSGCLPIEGGIETSKPNAEGKYLPVTVQKYLAGESGYVTVASRNPDGKYYEIGPLQVRDSQGHVVTIDKLTVLNHDKCGGCALNQFDVATGINVPQSFLNNQPFNQRIVQSFRVGDSINPWSTSGVYAYMPEPTVQPFQPAFSSLAEWYQPIENIAGEAPMPLESPLRLAEGAVPTPPAFASASIDWDAISYGWEGTVAASAEQNRALAEMTSDIDRLEYLEKNVGPEAAAAYRNTLEEAGRTARIAQADLENPPAPPPPALGERIWQWFTHPAPPAEVAQSDFPPGTADSEGFDDRSSVPVVPVQRGEDLADIQGLPNKPLTQSQEPGSEIALSAPGQPEQPAKPEAQSPESVSQEEVPLPRPAPQKTSQSSVASPQASGYKGSSIVDYLGSIGQPSSYSARKQLAARYGITGYRGTADQNLRLLKMLRGY